MKTYKQKDPDTGEIYYTKTTNPNSTRVDVDGNVIGNGTNGTHGTFPKHQPDIQRSPTDATPISENEPQIPTSDGTETIEDNEDSGKSKDEASNPQSFTPTGPSHSDED